MSKTKYHCDLNKRRLVLWLTVRLAPYAASYVDKNTAVRSLCPGRTKTTGVSQLFLCSRRRYSQWQQIAAGCTSCPARLLVLGLCSGTAWLCPRDKLELSLILKQRLETVLVSLATQPSLFSFFSSSRSLLSVSSKCTQSVRLRVKFGMTQKSWSLAKKRSFVLSSIYFACICVTGSSWTQHWPVWQWNVYCGRWLGVFKDSGSAHAHLPLSVWHNLKGDKNTSWE